MTFKKWLLTLMALLVVTDVTILLDIPVLRQILGFLYFITIPGLLTLYILKLNKIGFLKKFVLSVGLSLSFLIFAGLLINTLLPRLGYSKPLSTLPLVLCFSLAIAILGLSAYWRNKDSTQSIFSAELGDGIKNKHLWPLLFPLLFPLLIIIGRRVMDSGSSNIILVMTFLLIPLYVILIMWQNKKVPHSAYPLALGMIGVSILLARGFISNYLIGNDIYAEYHAFQVVYQNLHWSAEVWPTNVTASLSVSLLPAILQSILEINPLYIYKVVLLLPISLLPVIGYLIYKKYTGHLYGFLASFFFMSQLPFIYSLTGNIRLGIALIPFALATLVIFDDQITGWRKQILFSVFLISLVVVYYVLPILFWIMLGALALWMLGITKSSFRQNVAILLAVVLLPFLIYIWWGMLTSTVFDNYILIAKDVIPHLTSMFTAEVRGSGVVQLYTLPAFSLAMQIPGLIQRFSFLVIGIGVLSILFRREHRTKYSTYAILAASNLAILITMIIVPMVSVNYYSSERLFIQTLVVLAPAFIIGCQEILDGISILGNYLARLVKLRVLSYHSRTISAKFNPLTILIGVILIAQFISTSSLYQELFKLPGREIFDTKSVSYMGYYVYDSDVTAAKWLGLSKTKHLPVYFGTCKYPHCGEMFEFTDYSVNRDFEVFFFKNEKEEKPKPDSYVFLVHLNTVEGRVNGPSLKAVPGEAGVLTWPPLDICAHYYIDRNKIYANGSAEIYR
ncbi:DUF2206 domain-containing protein [Chloroflexota bacterium]